MPTAQQGGAVAAPDTAKIVLTVSEQYTSEEGWDAAPLAAGKQTA